MNRQFVLATFRLISPTRQMLFSSVGIATAPGREVLLTSMVRNVRHASIRSAFGLEQQVSSAKILGLTE